AIGRESFRLTWGRFHVKGRGAKERFSCTVVRRHSRPIGRPVSPAGPASACAPQKPESFGPASKRPRKRPDFPRPLDTLPEPRRGEASRRVVPRVSGRSVESTGVSEMGFKVAVAGATGNVGREMLTILEERGFPADEVVA